MMASDLKSALLIWKQMMRAFDEDDGEARLWLQERFKEGKLPAVPSQEVLEAAEEENPFSIESPDSLRSLSPFSKAFAVVGRAQTVGMKCIQNSCLPLFGVWGQTALKGGTYKTNSTIESWFR